MNTKWWLSVSVSVDYWHITNKFKTSWLKTTSIYYLCYVGWSFDSSTSCAVGCVSGMALSLMAFVIGLSVGAGFWLGAQMWLLGARFFFTWASLWALLGFLSMMARFQEVLHSERQKLKLSQGLTITIAIFQWSEQVIGPVWILFSVERMARPWCKRAHGMGDNVAASFGNILYHSQETCLLCSPLLLSFSFPLYIGYLIRSPRYTGLQYKSIDVLILIYTPRQCRSIKRNRTR